MTGTGTGTGTGTETEFDKYMLDSTAEIAKHVTAFEREMLLPTTPASEMAEIVVNVGGKLVKNGTFDTDPTTVMFKMIEQSSKMFILLQEVERARKDKTASFTPEFLARSRDVTKLHMVANGPPDAKDSVLRVLDEVHELTLAKTDGHIAEEACDVVLTCLALLHNLGLTDSQIGLLLSTTLAKAERKAPGRGRE